MGAAPNAARMRRIVDFYSKLPRGPAPERKPRGLMERYQMRYFGDNPSIMRKRALRSSLTIFSPATWLLFTRFVEC